MTDPLRIALVGHSNVGKTSLVAALTRDATLEVREEAGTTRRHYRKVVSIDGEPVLAFIDTPGFEQADAINRLLDELGGTGADALDGRAAIQAFLAHAPSDADFAEEKEALRGVLEADLLVYVVDVTAPPGGQQRQELRLLRRAGVPPMAVLNVLFEGDERAAWQELLRREQIFNIVPLDAMQFPAEQEEAFYAEVAKLRPESAGVVDEVRRLRAAQREANRERAALRIAEAFVDCMSFALVAEHPSREQAMAGRSQAHEAFKRAIRGRERALFDELAELYGHPALEVGGGGLAVQGESGDWRADLFDPEVLKRYGASIATLAAVGALTGSVLDSVGGFGIGTVLGGLGGAGLGHLVGRRIVVEVDASGRLQVGPLKAVTFPSALINRAVACWEHVARRSHARRDEVELAADEPPRIQGGDERRLHALARRCTKNPEWSKLGSALPDAARARTVDEVAELVRRVLGG